MNKDLPTGWYFPDLGDSDPMIPEDDREQKIVDLLRISTVHDIVRAELARRRQEHPEEYTHLD